MNKKFSLLQILLTLGILIALYSLFNFGNGQYKQIKKENKELARYKDSLKHVIIDRDILLFDLKEEAAQSIVNEKKALKTANYWQKLYKDEKNKIPHYSIDAVYDSIISIITRNQMFQQDAIR